MPLIPCPECGRAVSTAAEACPQCGHPSALVTRPTPDSEDPECYACTRPATTRCQACGELSCARHVDSVFVSQSLRGSGGGYELRCHACYQSAVIWSWVGVAAPLIILALILAFYCVRWK